MARLMILKTNDTNDKLEKFRKTLRSIVPQNTSEKLVLEHRIRDGTRTTRTLDAIIMKLSMLSPDR
jgi:hypothetical protein